MATAASDASGRRYATVAIWLHWIIGTLILLNIAAALVAERMEGPDRAQVMANHKSIGLTILMLSLLRLGWRLVHPAPPLAAHLKPAERGLARAVHALFYVLMILVPILGWIMSSAGDHPLAWFGVPVAKLPVAKGSPFAELSHFGHVWLGLGFLGLVALHVAGALKHQFIDRDNELARMLPFLRR